MQPAHPTNRLTPQEQANIARPADAPASCKIKLGGFTLIEMLIVLVIFGILLMIAAPAYQQMIRNNRMVSEVYGLRAIINNARSEAIARRMPVALCPTTNGTACTTPGSNNWTTGYITYVDVDNSGGLNGGDEIVQVKASEAPTTITFDNANQRVRFTAQGTAIGSTGTFTFCDDRGAKQASAIILNAVGSIRAATDTNSPTDDIVNDAGDDNVTC